jgi:mono/diheme cytochrome c family protein
MNVRFLLFALFLSLYVLASPRAQGADANSDKQMYLRYCSSCHGREGRGNGPVSRDLKVKVPDLTLLAKKHKGVYPLDDVMATIDGRRLVRGHGDREMPVWGENFRAELEEKKYPELTTLLKSKVIAEYVATLQQR